MTRPSIVLYGIKNCDTVKKARKWLDKNDVDYRFHDFRDDGMGDVPLQAWLEAFGWQQVLNRRSTSWRALDDGQKNGMDDAAALALAAETPTLIKRPVTVAGDRTLFGFREADFSELV
ncbi:ArsC family reductase [Microbulbifer litoralis]|uniref:ArsC family reductase n=1 Tax=Microbulbifer litoralis TaxID=2933965 RepID=UPI0020288F3D